MKKKHGDVIINVFLALPPSEDTLIAALGIAAYQADLINAHKRGEHPEGLMRRDCPLCQQS